MKTCILEAFREADDKICEKLLKRPDASEETEFSSGTVVCVALIKGDDLWVANLGDCRAVSCKENLAAAISEDHAPDKNRAEALRLQEHGVQVSGGYVGDHVAVSRAFGNICLKSGRKVGGLLCEPQIYHLICSEIDFLIMGSDGIWDALREQSALSHARKALRTTHKPEDAAAAVLRSAAKVSKSDNSAVIVIVFKFPAPLPARNPVQRVSLAQLEAAAAEIQDGR